ncbi:MAG: DUF4417 domain-containing protein [Clostridiales bacterium]|jgi:hypothetical protein|nr:DUF4417 domain-containing protein [Clostridiales bacterium]
MSNIVEIPHGMLNFNLIENAPRVGKYEIPKLKKTTAVAYEAVPFSEIGTEKGKKQKETDKWVHFFIHDKQFDRIWSEPEKYLSVLKKYKGVISTDFSMYTPFTFTMQLWNVHRNRTIAYWLQQNGIEVIPNVRWGGIKTFDFCFDGIEKGGTVAIGTNGCISNRVDRIDFKNGLAEMMRQIEPETVVVYGTMPIDIFGKYLEKGDTTFVRIPHRFVTLVAAKAAAKSEDDIAKDSKGYEVAELLEDETLGDVILETGNLNDVVLDTESEVSR